MDNIWKKVTRMVLVCLLICILIFGLIIFPILTGQWVFDLVFGTFLLIIGVLFLITWAWDK